jgi:hypothetical protein
MPRKSAAAIATLDPRGHRLEPPPGLSEAERAAFVAAVRSVKPGHFADEDTPLLTAYAAAIAQERAIAQDLEAAEEAEEDEKAKAKDRLRTAHGRVAGSLTRLARALRLGAMARAPSRNRRLPGTVEPSGPPPWEYRRGEGKVN